MPRMYAFAEDAVKQRVQKVISRGKVDVFIHHRRHSRGCCQGHRQPGPGGWQYAAALRELGEVCGLDCLSGDAGACWPGSPMCSPSPRRMRIWTRCRQDLCAVLDEALAASPVPCAGQRGKSWPQDIGGRLDTIEALTAQVEERSPQTVAEYRQKLDGPDAGGPQIHHHR